MANISSFKTVVLRAGECVVLPKDAVITSLIINGSITATSECTLPAPTVYKCGVFYFFVNSTGGDDDSVMEEEHLEYSKITVGGNTYIINEKVIVPLSSVIEPGIPTPIGTLNLHVTDTALFEFTAISVNDDPDNRQLFAVYFKVPEDLFDETVLQLSDRGTLYNLPPYEAECDEYPEPE